MSASTVYRLEANHLPDMHVLTRICEWLNVSPSTFFVESEGDTEPTGYSLAQILDLVRSDAVLTPSAANVLSALVKAAYQISQPSNTDT